MYFVFKVMMKMASDRSKREEAERLRRLQLQVNFFLKSNIPTFSTYTLFSIEKKWGGGGSLGTLKESADLSDV